MTNENPLFYEHRFVLRNVAQHPNFERSVKLLHMGKLFSTVGTFEALAQIISRTCCQLFQTRKIIIVDFSLSEKNHEMNQLMGCQSIALQKLLNQKILNWKPLNQQDIDLDEELFEDLQEYGIHAMITAPLRVDDKLQGLLFVGFENRESFQVFDRNFLLSFANLCALAMDRLSSRL